jgi:aminopeptidase C
MKTRNGFVSNSSSSSFIVAIPKDHPTQFQKEFTIDTYEEVTDEKQLLEQLEKRGYCEKDDLYEDCIKQLKKGNKIIFGCKGDQDDSVIDRGLCYGGMEEVLPEGGAVIQDCDGY